MSQGALAGQKLADDRPLAISDGIWRVEWWDTFRGEVLRRDSVRVAGGQLLLSIPDFARDVAAKIERAE